MKQDRNMKGSVGLIFSLMLILFMGSCSMGNNSGSVDKGILAPEFSLQDLQGTTVNLSKLRGKVVLLDFWATWCPPCRMEVPHFKEIHKEFTGKDFELVGMAVDKKQAVVDFVDENKIPFTIIVSDEATARKFNVSAFPTTFLISRDGTIARRWIGYKDKAVFVDAINEELKQ